MHNKNNLRRKQIKKRDLAVSYLILEKIKKIISNESKATNIFDSNSLLINNLNKKEVNKLQNSITTKNFEVNFKFIIIFLELQVKLFH